MSERPSRRMLNVIVAVWMVSSVLPVSLLVGTAGATALPPAPLASDGGVSYGDLPAFEDLTVLDAMKEPAIDREPLFPGQPAAFPLPLAGSAGPASSQSPAGSETTPGVPPAASSPAVVDPVSVAMIDAGVAPEDLAMPALDFLEKYPDFKPIVAEKTGVRALLADHYDFTPLEEQLILSRIQLQAVKSKAPPQFYSYADYMAMQGTRVPLAHSQLLVIDDDGSENNEGPGDANGVLEFPFTNQTELVTTSLANNSIAFDLYVRPYGGDLPRFEGIVDYDAIIYVTGQNYAGLGGLTFNRRLMAFIDAMGDFWIIGSMLPFALDGLLDGSDNATFPTLDPFALDYLGIESYALSGSANPMNGTTGEFLAGRSYALNEWIPNNLTFGRSMLAFAFSINYTGAVTKALTTGSALSFDSVTWTNVAGNIRTQFASKGMTFTSSFEFSYLTVGSERDDFVARMVANLTSQPGLSYDAGSNIAPSGVEVSPSIDSWTLTGWEAYNPGTGAFLGYYIFFSWFVERLTTVTITVTIDNYRGAVFQGDPRIVLEGDGTFMPDTYVENSTLFNAMNFPAASSTDITFTYVPHRMFATGIHATATVTLNDGDTTDNEIFTNSIGVAGWFDDVETLDPGLVNSGFTRVNNPAGALSGNFYWFTGTGANLNNSLTMPWIDVRCFNGTTAPPDMGPCAGRSFNLLGDLPYFVMWFNGSVTAPDALIVEFRGDGNMTWNQLISISITSATPLDYTFYRNIFGNQIVTFGLRVPIVAQDQFLQMRLRYVTGVGGASTGYKIDDFGVYGLFEKNNRVDFGPTFTNSIVAPSPSYTVYSGATPIATGAPGGIITVNETETVNVHAEIQDPHRDAFQYTWSQSVAGLATLPANSTGYIGSANMGFNVSTTLNSFEAVCAANGALADVCIASNANTATITLTATDELGAVNTTVWTLRFRDAVPVFTGPATILLDEDDMLCLAAGAASPWFTDPESQQVAIVGSSPLVNGSQTVTLSDQRAVNGTICIRASSSDWHGLANLTVIGTDSRGSASTVVIPVTVRPVNDAPRVSAAERAFLNNRTGIQNAYMSFNVTLFDVDNAQDTLTYTVDTNPTGMWTLQRNATGNLQFYNTFPQNDMVGYNFINVSICDPLGACTDPTVEFHVFVNNENDPPVISTTGEVRTVLQGTEFLLQVNVTDPDDLAPFLPRTVFEWSDDSDILDIDVLTGLIRFTPGNDDVGDQAVHITVRDNGNPRFADTLDIIIRVLNVNDPPVLPVYSDINVTQDQVFTAPLIKAFDPDLSLDAVLDAGDEEALFYTNDCPILFNITRIDQVNQGTNQREPSGQIRITASNAKVGDWDCVVTVTDKGGLSDSMSIHIRVNNVNDAPTGMKVNVTDQDTGETKTVTIDNGRVTFPEKDALLMEVIVDDPDRHMRLNEPGVPVDPTETLTCSILVTHVPSNEVPPTGAVEKPTVDPTQCISEFTPGNNEVGTFSITFTVRDSQQISVTFRIKLEITNINDPPEAAVVAPTASFSLLGSQSLTLTGRATDIDTPESLLTFSWKVEITGGRSWTQSGKTTTIQIVNEATDPKVVTVTLTVTDNLDLATPLTDTASVEGNIAGAVPPPPTLPIGMIAIIAVIAAAAGVGLMLMRRRKPKAPGPAAAPAPAAPAAAPAEQQYDQNYDYSQQGYDQNYDYSQQQGYDQQQYDQSQQQYQDPNQPQ